MTRTTRVAGSLWSTPRRDRENEARRLRAAGVDRMHWDVSDGRFTVPGGFDVDEARALMAAAADAGGPPGGEVHFMVDKPLDHVRDWLDLCDLVTVQVESEGWRETLRIVETSGRRAAVAISPRTPVETVHSLPDHLGVLVMAVEPGHAGTGFLPATLDRLDKLAGRALLGVDGSVDAYRARDCRRHGATWLVSGSSLCAAPDPAQWLRDALRDDEIAASRPLHTT